MQNKFIIGTRGSLLAVTQCTLIKSEIESKTGAEFTLEKIVTQGDQITDKPLWQLEGKDFFTKELDTALLSKDIDMVVHSYKDLGSERPENIKLGCVTERKYAHDILLIKKSKVTELASLKKLVVGTSSPRRIYNIEERLADFLPLENVDVSCKVLRGNVNTRIEKLLNDDYDAIILAFAGLERLASFPESKIILEGLLSSLDFMVLPQKYFPSSASQGALAIEFNETRDDGLEKILNCVHHPDTAAEIKKERTAFAKYGGGCHLAIGIHVKKVNDYFVHIHHGTHDGQRIEKLELEGYDHSSLKGNSVYYMHGKNDFLTVKAPVSSSDAKGANIFVTSALCTHNIISPNTLWSAGNRTMKKLIKSGFWINGSAEGFGHQEIKNFKESKLIQIFTNKTEWKVLSHNKAESSVGEIIASYTHESAPEDNTKDRLKELMSSDIIYWSSAIQFNTYLQKYPELQTKKHACGLGKTLTAFQKLDMEVIPCIDINHLKNSL